MRLGNYPCRIVPGTMTAEAYGVDEVHGAPPPPLRVQQRVPRGSSTRPAWSPAASRRTARSSRSARSGITPGWSARSSTRSCARGPNRPHPLFVGFMGASSAEPAEAAGAAPLEAAHRRRPRHASGADPLTALPCPPSIRRSSSRTCWPCLWYVAGLDRRPDIADPRLQTTNLAQRGDSFEEASHYQGILLVPGSIAVRWRRASSSGRSSWATTCSPPAGWWFVEVIYIITLLVCVPFIGMGLRRARIAALQARRKGASTPELDQAMDGQRAAVLRGDRDVAGAGGRSAVCLRAVLASPAASALHFLCYAGCCASHPPARK